MNAPNTKTISLDVIQDALECAGLNESVETVNDAYLGRGLNPSPCLSFVIEGGWPQRALCRFMVELGLWAQEAFDLGDLDDLNAPDVVRALSNVVSTDNLGMDTIVYFPGWTLVD